MSGRSGQFAILAALVALVAGGVWLSEEVDRKPVVSEAVAAAIKADLAWYIEAATDQAATGKVAPEVANLCLASDQPLDYDLLAVRLAGSFLHVVPVADCTSKTVEGDFGMFSAMTTWFDGSGKEAGFLTVQAVHCQTARRCIVDTASIGAGMRYQVDRVGDVWAVTNSEMRWVV